MTGVQKCSQAGKLYLDQSMLRELPVLKQRYKRFILRIWRFISKNSDKVSYVEILTDNKLWYNEVGFMVSYFKITIMVEIHNEKTEMILKVKIGIECC